MNNLERFRLIYHGIFKFMIDSSYYIFLCGGAGKDHIRNQVRTLLEKEGYQIFYPEDLFMDIINKNKKEDLLMFENFLASNSDVICVICESMGSAVELGAFVQNDGIKNKMLVATESKYSRDKSFINMGPIKHLQKTYDDRVLSYKKSDIDKFVKDLEKAFKKIKRRELIVSNNLSPDKLSTYIAFIPLVIWFYGEIHRKKLYHTFKELLQEEKNFPTRYSDSFNTSIKYLLKVRTIITGYDGDNSDEQYSLSPSQS